MTDVGGELVPEGGGVEGEGAVADGFGSSAWNCEDSVVCGRA